MFMLMYRNYSQSCICRYPARFREFIVGKVVVSYQIEVVGEERSSKEFANLIKSDSRDPAV